MAAYTKVHTSWKDGREGGTPITAAALDQIEAGIATAQSTADTATTAAATADGKAVTAQGEALVHGRVMGWVADDAQDVALGTIPANSFITAFRLQVTELFNASGTDNISAGVAADHDSIFTNTDVSTTGVKTPVAGVDVGFAAGARDVHAYYTAGGGSPTTGKALVIVEYTTVSAQVA